MRRPRVLALTGSRADYGLIRAVLRRLAAEPTLELLLVVTGAHLASEFGATEAAIAKDGFAIAQRVDMLLAGDTPGASAKSLGLGAIGFADAYERLRPDLVLIPGDRYEMLAAAATALVMGAPIAHLFGGDVTEGAFDDSIRHAITKMASLHFVTTPEAGRRVRQMGEDPARVHEVGHPALDLMGETPLIERSRLEAELPFDFRARNLLVTFHPETTAPGLSAGRFGELLRALDRLGPETGLIFTRPNADPEGRRLAAMMLEFVAEHANAACFASLGEQRYWSVMATVDAVVGNSSSGILETPSFRKPTVNVGDRQKGRQRAASIIDVPADAAAIAGALERAFELDCSRVVNPYGDGRSAERIVAILKDLDWASLTPRKRFVDQLPDVVVAGGSSAQPLPVLERRNTVPWPHDGEIAGRKILAPPDRRHCHQALARDGDVLALRGSWRLASVAQRRLHLADCVNHRPELGRLDRSQVIRPRQVAV